MSKVQDALKGLKPFEKDSIDRVLSDTICVDYAIREDHCQELKDQLYTLIKNEVIREPSSHIEMRNCQLLQLARLNALFGKDTPTTGGTE